MPSDAHTGSSAPSGSSSGGAAPVSAPARTPGQGSGQTTSTAQQPAPQRTAPAPAAPRPAAAQPSSAAQPAATPLRPASAPDTATEGKLVIGKGVSMTGEVTDAKAVLVEGGFNDATIIAGRLVIGAAGHVSGNATVTSADIHGRFEGTLEVEAELTLHGTGSVSGRIRYGELEASRGARIEGDIRSGAGGDDDETLVLDTEETAGEAAAPAQPPRGMRNLLGRK